MKHYLYYIDFLMLLGVFEFVDVLINLVLTLLARNYKLLLLGSSLSSYQYFSDNILCIFVL